MLQVYVCAQKLLVHACYVNYPGMQNLVSHTSCHVYAYPLTCVQTLIFLLELWNYKAGDMY